MITQQLRRIFRSNRLYLRRVVGHSMQPTLQPGQIVLLSADTEGLSEGDIVLARIDGKDYIKRLKVVDGQLQLIGDNREDSQDILHVTTSDIIARRVRLFKS